MYGWVIFEIITMWTYNQSTGQLTNNGVYVGTGYSGMAQAKNNPDMEQIPNMGCIPRGHYTICEPHESDKTGTYTLALIPDFDNHMFGRSDFEIHGDSIERPGQASEGCIILAPAIRTEIWTSGDRKLEVV